MTVRLPGQVSTDVHDGYMCYICGEVKDIFSGEFYGWSPRRYVCHRCHLRIMDECLKNLTQGHLPEVIS